MVDYCCRKKYLLIILGQILQRQVLQVLRMTVILKFRGLGIQSLEIFEKCQVDILGNISVVRHENRQEFH